MDTATPASQPKASPTERLHVEPLITREGLKVVRLSIPTGGDMPLHHSNVDVVITVVKGRGIFTIADVPRAIAPGDVLDMPPGVPHFIHADEALELCVVHARLASKGDAPAASHEAAKH